jgi:crotonobetainyl-CoA:carnitine CoA-transferase CaiB-like acyl-CoA transferase
MEMALEGIKVIDISQVVAVPVAARHLADFGADVIKIEHPKRGDFWRRNAARTAALPTPIIDHGFENWNRNKRSIGVDIASEEGQKIIYHLVEKADVFVNNLRPWEKEKYKLGYDVLKKINPRIIYGTVTGLGKNGPEKDMPGFDVNTYFYRAGIRYVMTPVGYQELSFRAGFGDTIAGMSLFAGVMTALYNREKTGMGQEVDISLFHTGIYQISSDISGVLITKQDVKGAPQATANIDPERAKIRAELIAEVEKASGRLADFNRESLINSINAVIYRSKDGKNMYFSALQPESYWGKVCRAIGQPELEHDPRFETQDLRHQNHIPLYHILKEAFSRRNFEEWKQKLNENSIPWAPEQRLPEVIEDPQAVANNIFPVIEHPTWGKVPIIASPINLSETPATYRKPAPEFSQHTEEIMLEYGYGWEDIAHFKDKGVIS